MISWNRKILFYPFNPFLYPSVFVFSYVLNSYIKIQILFSLNYFLTRIKNVEEPSKMKLASINVKGGASRYKLTLITR